MGMGGAEWGSRGRNLATVNMTGCYSVHRQLSPAPGPASVASLAGVVPEDGGWRTDGRMDGRAVDRRRAHGQLVIPGNVICDKYQIPSPGTPAGRGTGFRGRGAQRVGLAAGIWGGERRV